MRRASASAVCEREGESVRRASASASAQPRPQPCAWPCMRRGRDHDEVWAEAWAWAEVLAQSATVAKVSTGLDCKAT